jgi:hypothetical protein
MHTMIHIVSDCHNRDLNDFPVFIDHLRRLTDYSPDGPANEVPSFAGVPKLGVLSEFQFTFCAIVYLVPSQAPALLASA